MSERGDHLIERAAARLREAKGGSLPGAAPVRPVVEPSDGPPALPSTAPTVPGFRPFAAPPPNRVGVVEAEPPAGVPLALAEARSAEGRAAGQPVPGPADFGDAQPGLRPADAVPGERAAPEVAAPPPMVQIGRGANGAFPTARAGGGGSTQRVGQPGLPAVQLDALERAGMVVARTTRTRISEEYRIVIGRILRSLHEATEVQGARNVLMVTSARPGEGKSFTALNLAGSIAQNGTDAVLLIDVDPKVRPLSDQLGLGESQGFLDLVSDPSLRPEDMLRTTAIPNLTIMPVGTRLGGAAQTLGGTASTRPIIPTISRLARRFPKHLIMLDAPPCLSTSDPHTLAPHVGQVVLVVEAERTQRSEVEAAIELVRVCPTITMLLNKVRMTTSHTFGAYDYFGSYT